jgi:hypothetical protein
MRPAACLLGAARRRRRASGQKSGSFSVLRWSRERGLLMRTVLQPLWVACPCRSRGWREGGFEGSSSAASRLRKLGRPGSSDAWDVTRNVVAAPQVVWLGGSTRPVIGSNGTSLPPPTTYVGGYLPRYLGILPRRVSTCTSCQAERPLSDDWSVLFSSLH